MLDPAPPPEGGRGSAFALRQPRNAQEDGRAVRRFGAGGGLFQRGPGRADRVGRGQDGRRLLLPGNEHPFAGRTSGDGGDYLPGPGRADDPRRQWRGTEISSGASEDQWLGDREPSIKLRPLSDRTSVW